LRRDCDIEARIRCLQKSENIMQTYPPGTRIGQYEIASRPMMGGMGVVYFALDHGNDGRPVASKPSNPNCCLIAPHGTVSCVRELHG